jgi:hypothetical protein
MCGTHYEFWMEFIRTNLGGQQKPRVRTETSNLRWQDVNWNVVAQREINETKSLCGKPFGNPVERRMAPTHGEKSKKK